VVAGNGPDGSADIHDFVEARSEESVVSTRLRAIEFDVTEISKTDARKEKRGPLALAVTVQAEFYRRVALYRTFLPCRGDNVTSSGRGAEVRLGATNSAELSDFGANC